VINRVTILLQACDKSPGASWFSGGMFYSLRVAFYCLSYFVNKHKTIEST
jgi:hypothetical protein